MVIECDHLVPAGPKVLYEVPADEPQTASDYSAHGRDRSGQAIGRAYRHPPSAEAALRHRASMPAPIARQL